MIDLHAHTQIPLHLFSLLAQGDFGFDFGPATDGLFGLLGSVLQIIAQIFEFLWNTLVIVFNYLFAVIVAVYRFFVNLFAGVSRVFKWVWDNVVKGAITKIVDLFTRVRTFLQKIFAPILHWLRIARKLYDLYFNKYIKPILNLIQHMRQVLKVFELLGFKWAKQLDALLGKIQADIAKVYTTLRSYLNQAITWIDLIVDPGGILRRNPLFAAIIRSAKELENIRLQATQRPLTAGEADMENRNRTWFNSSASKSNFDFYKQGKLPPDMEAARQEFLKANTDAGSA